MRRFRGHVATDYKTLKPPSGRWLAIQLQSTDDRRLREGIAVSGFASNRQSAPAAASLFRRHPNCPAANERAVKPSFQPFDDGLGGWS